MSVKALPLDQLISIETSGRAGDFVQLCSSWAAGKGSPSDARHEAEQRRAADRVVGILKAATNPGTIGNETWGANLTAFDGLAAAFLESLRGQNVFDTLLGSMRKCPLLSAVSVVALSAAGADVSEGNFKPVDALEIGTSGPLTPRKAAALVVMTRDLWRSISSDAQSLVRRELSASVSAATDAEFFATIFDGVSPAASSSGSDVDAVRGDLAALLSAVETGQSSKLFLVMSSPNAKALAIMGGDGGGFGFRDMTPLGGTIAGIPVLVSDSIEPDEVALIDASGIAASAGTVIISSASHATVRMSSTPESDTALTSLWQKNMLGLRAERNFGCARIRDNSVAFIDTADYANVVTA